MMRLRSNLRGFSLIELVVVIVILAILGAVGSALTSSAIRSYFTSQGRSDADWQGRLALARMARDIRIVRPGTITTATASRFTFTDKNSNAVDYQLTGTNLMRNTDILAEGISSLTFTYLDSTTTVTATLANIRYVGVVIALTQGGVNYSVQTMLELRDFAS